MTITVLDAHALLLYLEKEPDLGNIAEWLEAAARDRTLQASRFKTEGDLSYADCFAASLALLREAKGITGDPAFEAVEDRVAIRWIPSPEEP